MPPKNFGPQFNVKASSLLRSRNNGKEDASSALFVHTGRDRHAIRSQSAREPGKSGHANRGNTGRDRQHGLMFCPAAR